MENSVYRKFLNARSPLRLLEKGLHGGLGPGNLGVVLAGHGVGKSAFLVGVALDELLRSGTVLHVSLDATVAHVRAYYDTLFDELVSSKHLADEVKVRAEVDSARSIRVYPPNSLTTAKLREAVKVESDAGARPSLLIVEGLDFEHLPAEDLQDLKLLATELAAEVWLSVACGEEKVSEIPASLAEAGDLVSVILALEPSNNAVALRALKDHDNPDLSALHVALDPLTLLLIRN